MKSRDDAARMPRGRDMGDPGRDRVKGEPIRCEGTWSSQGAGAVSRRAGSLDGRSLIVVRPSSRQCEVGPSLGLTLTPPLSSCARLLGVTSPHCEPESSHSPSGDPALTPDCRYCLSLLDVPVLVRLGPGHCVFGVTQRGSPSFSLFSLSSSSLVSLLFLSPSLQVERYGTGSRCGEMRGDMGRCGEMRGDVGRYSASRTASRCTTGRARRA